MRGLNNRPPPAYSDTAHTSPAAGSKNDRSLPNKNNTAHHWYDDIELSDLLSDNEEEGETPASNNNSNQVQPTAKTNTGGAARVVKDINARVAPAPAPATPPRATNVDVDDVDLEAAPNRRSSNKKKKKMEASEVCGGPRKQVYVPQGIGPLPPHPLSKVLSAAVAGIRMALNDYLRLMVRLELEQSKRAAQRQAGANDLQALPYIPGPCFLPPLSSSRMALIPKDHLRKLNPWYNTLRMRDE
ncbi:hypothetical protein GE09DRAFT_1048712 [Coniochaeta sp. 2T2.1]|nr:hypothetical protein GE09DRAFT_1048712 [Coniochaeta sp. 2T2.1]